MIYDRKNYINKPSSPKKDGLGWQIYTVVAWILLIILGLSWSAYNSQNILPHWPHYHAPTAPISVPKACQKGWVECDLG